MYLLPTTVLYIPLYMLVSKMHLTNTIWGLIVIYPTFTLPYVAWILIPHIAAVPKELEEAAKVDGCSRIGTMYKIENTETDIAIIKLFFILARKFVLLIK